MDLIIEILQQSWHLLLASSIYILFGIFVAGLMRVFISPENVVQHFGHGKIRSVFKAALLGIPLPLCSCGVLPAAASLKKQGANNGAVMSFLISTPESGVDSIAITYALLDPILTVARPVAAFVAATVAGIMENLRGSDNTPRELIPDLCCTIDACCDGITCPPEVHRRHHPFFERVRAGTAYAFGTLWADLAVWFLVGIFLAGIISTVVPPELMTRYLGGGLTSMLIMLAVGIPLYICATASTPIAAALILQGVSPGAALVFLLTGPATNVTSLTVLLRILGKRATVLYLAAIALSSVAFGLLIDEIYRLFNISAQAIAGQAGEMTPYWLELSGAVVIVALSAQPVHRAIRARFQGSADTVCSDACSCQAEASRPVKQEDTCCSGDGCGCNDEHR